MLARARWSASPISATRPCVDLLSSNLCRCTGYQNIVKAVRAAVAELRQGKAVRSETDRWRFQRQAKLVGQSVMRLEDRPLLTGRGRFAADISFSASTPHARRALELCARPARDRSTPRRRCALPGVHAVWTAADIADIPPIEFRAHPVEGLAPYRQPVLASGRVRYVGEPVAAVFADDPYLAEDAAELVDARDRGAARHPARRWRARRIRRRAAPPSRLSSARATATSTRPSPPHTPSSRSSCRSAGIPACRSRPAARSRATTRRATCLSFTAPRRCRTGTATRWRGCWGARPHRCTSSRGMSAAASAFAANSIRRTCWSAPRRCACAGR